MENVWIAVCAAISGSAVTIAANQFVEYRKRASPKILYSAAATIPVKVEGRYFGAYALKISNPSRKKVEQVTFHLRAREASLRLEKLSMPPGLVCNQSVSDGALNLLFPYLKRGDEVTATAFAESDYYVPDSLSVSVSSPHDVIAVDAKGNERPSFFQRAASIASASVLGMALCFAAISFGRLNYALRHSNDAGTDSSSGNAGQSPAPFRPDVRNRVISAASLAGVPHIAELYFLAPDPKYYDEGDLAYSFAATSGKKEEITKYRKLISFTLASEPNMAVESQANLLYSLGRIDILLSDDGNAVSDFQNAISKSKSTVESRAKGDVQTHKFLIDRGLL